MCYSDYNYWSFVNMNGNDPRDGLCKAIKSVCSAILALLAAAFVCSMLGSCKSVKYVSVPEVHTDTFYINKMQRDSIWLHDSIHVVEKQVGDTLYLLHDRWHTKYVENIIYDTIYQSRTDSVGFPYPVEVKVEKPLSWWQKTRLRIGEIFIGIMGVLGIIGIIRIKRKFMP